MKAKSKHLLFNLRKNALMILNRFRSGTNLFSIALFIAAAAVIITSGNREALSDINIFETGKVADRDVIAQHAVTFVDEKATMARLEIAAKQVPAVFRFSPEETRKSLDLWNSFCDLTDKQDSSDTASFRLAINEEYPAFFSNETLDAYLSASGRSVFRGYGVEALNSILAQGVFSFHREDIRHFHSDIAELQGVREANSQKVFVTYGDIITLEKVRDVLDGIVISAQAPALFKTIAVDLLAPFVRENVFFSYGESQRRIEEAKGTITPVIRSIEKGKRIIRKGFIISEDEMEELRSLHLLSPRRDPRNIIGTVLLVFLIYLLFLILRGRLILGRKLNNSERYLIASISGFYIIGSILLNNISPGGEGFPVSLLVPTSL